LATTTTTTLPPPPCPKNPQGGPDEAILTVADKCTDLDNGWTGTSHNFPVTPGSQLFLCISGCDASTNPNCTATAPIGAGTLNGVTFGPPLPLLAAQVPVCVLNRFQTPPTATGNIQTGTMDLQVKLFSDVFLTSVGLVCPRCKNGTCDSGPNMGQACKVDGTVTVAQAAGDKVYPVSRDCPTDAAHAQFAGTLNIDLPLTTGTSSLEGSRPCRAQPGDPSVGIPVQDDQCGAGVCNSACTGLACVSHAADCPGNPCVDSKGGLSQFCCSNDSTKPCYPTGNPAIAKIERTGIPMPPTPVWPDPTYPKMGTGTVVSVFCEPATTANTINTTAGLPGPGALILPGTQVWLKSTSLSTTTTTPPATTTTTSLPATTTTIPTTTSTLPATTTTTSLPATTTTTTLPCTSARCAVDAGLTSPLCAGQVPASVTKKLDRAASLIEQASTSPAKQAKKLRKRAKTALKKAKAAATRAAKGKKPKISSDCASALKDTADRIAAVSGLLL